MPPELDTFLKKKIISKINGYKVCDKKITSRSPLNNKLSTINLDEAYEIILKSNGICEECDCVYLFKYESNCRLQFSFDRVDENLIHSRHNLRIICLSCNVSHQGSLLYDNKKYRSSCKSGCHINNDGFYYIYKDQNDINISNERKLSYNDKTFKISTKTINIGNSLGYKMVCDKKNMYRKFEVNDEIIYFTKEEFVKLQNFYTMKYKIFKKEAKEIAKSKRDRKKTAKLIQITRIVKDYSTCGFIIQLAKYRMFSPVLADIRKKKILKHI